MKLTSVILAVTCVVAMVLIPIACDLPARSPITRIRDGELVTLRGGQTSSDCYKTYTVTCPQVCASSKCYDTICKRVTLHWYCPSTKKKQAFLEPGQYIQALPQEDAGHTGITQISTKWCSKETACNADGNCWFTNDLLGYHCSPVGATTWGCEESVSQADTTTPDCDPE